MIFNQPNIQILDDQDHQTVISVSGVYTSACTGSNGIVIQANTFYGANASLPCIISVNAVEYDTSFANGSATLEYVSNGNNNTTIATMGRNNSGNFSRYIRNQANTPTGDINLLLNNVEPSDTFMIIVSFLKEYQGCAWANAAMAVGQNYGSGAWANAQAHYSQPGVY
jgi:hypothetical protein